jgi:pyruvate formate lyase activating enzyme
MEGRVGKEDMLDLDELRRIKVRVAGWKELSLVDIIGEPSFTIWFNYCNLRCPWCQNSHVVTGEVSMEVEVGELVNLIKENSKLVKYVHATGGEPTLQPDGLEALFLLSKQIGEKTSLSTNGTNFEVIKKIIGELDHLALDLKGPITDPKRYAYITGSNPSDCIVMTKAIDSSLRIGIDNVPFVEVRTTLVPSLLSSEDILNLAEYVSDLAYDSTNRVVYVIQQYIPSETLIDQRFRDVEKIPASLLIKLGKTVKERTQLKEVYVRAIELGTVKV